MSNSYEFEQILSKLLVHETIDGLFFWGPKLLLSTDMINYDEVFLCIEGTCTITEQSEQIAALLYGILSENFVSSNFGRK